jgi:ubiquinone/menaquinone biosynthesis C-methylase UbiE
MQNSKNINDFFDAMKNEAKLLFPKIYDNYNSNQVEFNLLAGKMLDWTKKYLGDSSMSDLVLGYKAFVADVNRSQMKYERSRQYENSSYDEVFKKVYDNNEFMQDYFWGVYVTTFAWEHHLELNSFFRNHFLNRISTKDLKIIDLGSGSGIWSMLTADECPNVSITGVDISKKTIALAREFVDVNDFGSRISFQKADATTYKTEELNDFGISCFLIEHLEEPMNLLKNLNSNLKEHGIAFITAALTAAEIDHIYEIKKESELIKLAEDSGFRVLSSFSAAPKNYPKKMKFLPRSMALILQKKNSEFW